MAQAYCGSVYSRGGRDRQKQEREALDSADEDAIEFKFQTAALILFWAGTFGSHMIGAKIGLLPPVFPKRKKEQA